MTEIDGPRSNPEDRREPALLREALGYLTGEGRRQGAAALLDGLYARFREAGREKLADLVYEMAKACLAALPDFSVRTLLRSEPRAPEVISGELSTMSDCLQGVEAAPDLPDLGGVARRRPEPPAALDDARKCLDVLASLEGESGRQQLARALCEIHAGQSAAAERLLRALLARRSEAAEIARIAEVNLAFALLRQGRYAEVLPVAHAGIARSPDDPVPWFNLLAASAELADREGFEHGIEALRSLYARTGSALIARWIERDLRMLGRLAGLPAERLDALAQLPAAPAPGATPGGDAPRPREPDVSGAPPARRRGKPS